MSKGKSNFGAIPKMHAQIWSFKTTYKTSCDEKMSHLNSY